MAENTEGTAPAAVETKKAAKSAAEEQKKFAEVVIKAAVEASVKAAEKRAARIAVQAADRAAHRAVQKVFANADLLVWEGVKQGAVNLVTLPYAAVASGIDLVAGLFAEPKKKKARA